jgi:predicted phosphodiesterase
MRYVFVSDIHGQYQKLMDALEAAKFNKETDTIVSLGDPFDRGWNSKEVLEFLMSCPNRLLVWGNHDYRLKQICRHAYADDYIAGYDISNGIPQTLISLTGLPRQCGLDNIVYMLTHDPDYKETWRLLLRYFSECVWALEWKDLIAVHGWLPVKVCRDPKIPNLEKRTLIENWRDLKKDSETIWEDAAWGNTVKCAADHCYPEKPMIIGHWHAFGLAEVFGHENRFLDDKTPSKIMLDTPVNTDLFIYKEQDKTRFIAIDGCTVLHCGKVNTYVYESDEAPIKYDLR